VEPFDRSALVLALLNLASRFFEQIHDRGVVTELRKLPNQLRRETGERVFETRRQRVTMGIENPEWERASAFHGGP
jgi:hypothetical protein